MSPASLPRGLRLRRAGRRTVPAAAAACLAFVPSALFAETKTWIGNNGDWSNDAAWISPGRPRDGDTAVLGNASGAGITLTYSNTTVSLNELFFAGGNDITLNQTGGSLTSVNETFGGGGFAVASTHRQDLVQFSSNTVTGTLTIGDASNASAIGLYDLIFGRLDANVIRILSNGTLNVGDQGQISFTTVHQSGNVNFTGGLGLFPGKTYNLNGGTLTARSHGIQGGTFNQTGGVVDVSAPTGGLAAMLSGEYNLGGGELRSHGYQIFATGEARFVQTGGLHVITGNPGTSGIQLITSSSNARYELKGGDIVTPGLYLVSENPYLSLFDQTGGTNTIQLLDTAGGAVYQLQNGLLNARSIRLGTGNGGGLLDQSGGTLDVGDIALMTGAAFIHRGGTLDYDNFYHLGGTVAGSIHNRTTYFYESGDFTGRFVNDGVVDIAAPTFVIGQGLDNRASFTIPSQRTVNLGREAAPSVNSGTITMDDAVLTGNSLLNAPPGRLVGLGAVQLALENHGTITASGGNLTIAGNLNNQGGTLENAPGSNLLVTGNLINDGNVVVRAGGSVAFNAPLLNSRGRTITLAGGTLASPIITNEVEGTISGAGDIAGNLVNDGAIALTAPTRILGTLTNHRRATISAAGKDEVRFTQRAVNDGQIIVHNGTIIFDASLTGDRGEGSGEILLNPGGNIVADSLRQSLLSLDGAPRTPASATLRRADARAHTVSVLGSLHIAGSAEAWYGRFDLADNTLILRATAGTRDAVLATVESQIAAARNGSAERWLGNGVTSTAAAANPLTTLAALINPGLATFDGEAVDANAVIIDYTYNGDANLDGRINADDYFRIDQGFLSRPPDPSYREGDFNYDNVVNADDYFLIDQAFLGQGAPLGAGAGLAAASVPEPGVVATTLACAAGALLRRRRR
jgi:hypothetical protein